MPVQKMQPQPWIKARIKELGKPKTLRGLGLAMGGLDSARLTEIGAGTRSVKAGEIAPMAEYLEMTYDEVYGRLFGTPPESRTKNEHHNLVTSRIDTAQTVLVPLWDITAPGGTASGAQLQLTKSGSWVAAPQELRLVQNSFAVQAWDDDNAPWVPRGSTLFVNPSKKARDGQWCLFLASEDWASGLLERPCMGLLLGRTATTWKVQRGSHKTILTQADWPHNWLIEWIKP
jgi:hypothetical protein